MGGRGLVLLIKWHPAPSHYNIYNRIYVSLLVWCASEGGHVGGRLPQLRLDAFAQESKHVVCFSWLCSACQGLGAALAAVREIPHNPHLMAYHEPVRPLVEPQQSASMVTVSLHIHSQHMGTTWRCRMLYMVDMAALPSLGWVLC